MSGNIDREEMPGIVRAMLDEHLRVHVTVGTEYGARGKVLNVKLTWDGEDISEDSVSLPNTDGGDE